MRALPHLRPIARTLGHRNFAIYTAGGSVSLIGTWMQRIAAGWLAWELSHSGTVLGLVAFADLAPAVLIGPFGGVLADRTDRRRVMMVAQVLIMAQAAVLFALTVSGLITVELLLGLVLFGGVVIGFNQPARLAFVPSLVPRRDLGTAVALNSMVFNGARFVGPAVAGVVIVQAGIAWVFALNALTFVAFLVALSRLRLEPPLARTPAERPPMVQALADGLRYTAAHPLIGPILLLHAMIGISARPFIELLPGFVDQVFGRGASGLAILSSSVGIGAVVGALWLAGRSNDGHLIKALLISSLLVPLSTLAFSMVTWFPAAVACVTLAGFAMVVAGVGTQTVIQMVVEETMRGRVLSLFGLVFRSAPALGALAMGAASELVGLPLPVGLGSLVGIAACALIWRHRPALEAAAAGD